MSDNGALLRRPHAARHQDAVAFASPEALAIVEKYRQHRRELPCSKSGAEGSYGKAKRTVLAHYGTSCACCGATDNLTIDHIDGKGTAHRKELNNPGGRRFYLWLIRNGFPSGYQTLCNPCNASKNSGPRCRIEHDLCPTCRRPLEAGEAIAIDRGVRFRAQRARVQATNPEKDAPDLSRVLDALALVPRDLKCRA